LLFKRCPKNGNLRSLRFSPIGSMMPSAGARL
jgi:hypothetical protein